MKRNIGLSLSALLLFGGICFIAWCWFYPKPSAPKIAIVSGGTGFVEDTKQFSVGLATYIAGKEKPVRWEHGWKTSRVTATYRPGTMVGYTIVFEFPKNIYDADRAEVMDFFELYEGNVYEGGGYAGAPAYATFKDVDNQEQADKKLQAMLPDLTELMENLDNKEYTKKVQARIDKLHEHDPVWPDTTPPDKSDPYWEFNQMHAGFDGAWYIKKEVSPGKWQWVLDKETMAQEAAAVNHKRAIWTKLCTQLMTDKEFAEAVAYGENLNIEEGVSYFAADKRKELEDCFVAQNRMRVDSGKHTHAVTIPGSSSSAEPCTQGMTLAPGQSCSITTTVPLIPGTGNEL